MSAFLRRLFCATLPCLALCPAWAAGPVEFVFKLPADKQNPFARDVWAEIVTPSQKTLRLPAYFAGDDRFAVRARADEKGDYRLGPVTELKDDKAVPLVPKLATRDRITVKQTEAMSPVRRDAGDSSRLVLAGGGTYVPVGANVAWASTGGVRFYLRTFEEFHQAGLNWMRIWMAHWGRLNLDWLPEDMGPSPPPGVFDERVAGDWDRIVAAAGDNGVYLQITLQHHGQYSSKVNPNWPENPWNAARGGFLHSPGEFFTSPVARGFTALKYRYIVARWGYSPAVLAWEFFNEVHWIDDFRRDEAAVARWHDQMAAFVRSIDPYRHLVTTSTDNLHSPVYASMDYFQPHLYASNLLAGVRQFAATPVELDRPVFYGEVGDDHMPLTDEQKKSGIAIVPPVWASLMGRGRYPAQAWLGEMLLQKGRLGELGAVARFLAATHLGERAGLVPFSPVVACAQRVPLKLLGGQVWQRRAAPAITLPLDGRELVEFADIPRIFGGAPNVSEGFPGRATYQADFPRDVTLRARAVGMGANGAALRFSVDGSVVAEKSWRAQDPDAPSGTHPVELAFPVSAGRHTLLVENPGAPDWVDLAEIDLGLDTPVLVAVGRRNDDFIALWVWHRTGVMALDAPAPVAGEVQFDDVPAGTWQVTWWDTLTGQAAGPITLQHPGGLLKLPTPPVARHAAVVLTR